MSVFDKVALGCAAGLVALGWAWRRASGRTWYRNTDDEPVSARSVLGFFWLVCLMVVAVRVGRLLGLG